MADEPEKKAEDRKDADGGQTLDKLLKGIDAVTTKLDAMSSRMDAVEKRMDDDDKKRHDDDARRAKKDDDDDDRRAKKDDNDDDDRKDDARRAKKDAKHRKDAEPEEEMEDGDPEPVAADKKRRHDDDARRAKKDDDDDDRKDDDRRAKKDDDDDDDDKKSRKDSSSVTHADLKNLRDQIAKEMPKPLNDADYAAFADAQSRHDAVFSTFGESAPRPLQGETLLAYRRRMATKLKQFSQVWKDVDLAVVAVDEAAFAIAEKQILEAAAAFARNPASIPAGRIRAVARKLPSGHQVTEFFGDPAAWMDRFSTGGKSISKINMMKGN